MDKILQINEPIWVVDPHTKQRVNVEPFLQTLSQFDSSQPNAPLNLGALELMHRVIRNMTLIVHDYNVIRPDVLANMYNDLWMLRDMFEATATVSQ